MLGTNNSLQTQANGKQLINIPHTLSHEDISLKISNFDTNQDINLSQTRYGQLTKILIDKCKNKMVICSNSDDHVTTITIKNISLDSILYKFQLDTRKIDNLDLSKDGKLIALSQSDGISIWDLNAKKIDEVFTVKSGITTCFLELNNHILITGCFDKSLKLWDLKDSNQSNKTISIPKHVVKSKKQGIPWCLLLISEDQVAISSGLNINIYQFNNNTYQDFKVVKTLRGHTNIVLCLRMVEKNKDLLLSSSYLKSKELRLWSISKNMCLRTYHGHSNQIYDVLLISDKIFISSSGEIKFWNLYSGECIKTISREVKTLALAKTRRNMMVFGGYEDKLIELRI